MKYSIAIISGLLLTAAISGAQAEPTEKPARRSGESQVMLHSTITGNQEQPKVLYIVPWQGPGGTDPLNTGLQPVISDVFAPIDRNEFQRELKYREMTVQEQ